MTTTADLPDPPLVQRLTELATDSAAWLTGHSTRIIIAMMGGAAIIVLLYALKWLGGRVSRMNGARADWRWVIGSALKRTRLWFMLAVALEVVARYGQAPADIAWVIHVLFVIGASLQGAVYARAVSLAAIEQRADGNGELGSALHVIRLLVTVALFTIAIILILSNLGVNVTGLIAGLGIGGIAIGLAAQGIFADLFAALSILFDRPFRVGDSVRWDTTQGDVEAIGLKTTRVRALTGEEVVISNTNLLGKEIHNYARLARRRIVMTLSIVYQTPPETAARLPDIVRGIVEHEGAQLVRCGMVNFAPSSLDFEVHYNVQSEDYETVFQTRHRINIAILKRFAAEGITFAYPTQTTFTAAPDGTYVMPYAAPSESNIVER